MDRKQISRHLLSLSGTFAEPIGFVSTPGVSHRSSLFNSPKCYSSAVQSELSTFSVGILVFPQRFLMWKPTKYRAKTVGVNTYWQEVERRDHGICAKCGLNTFTLWRALQYVY